ncbi:major facilitator superfamily domain-containing protein [Protomyces lactucae-debilis]|uniref:Major facilitator superfamily domain-containing protein n=1 Tax=Protomyces lactucae-debilis TaxID=2754530 RepID=A0A1Y2ETG8_PROLT|nr:major facilitator superfamily domain-containing protein [Protomyces lactucae-debilis]ORY74135.1 major facilitator superfamily domain-containing protein [Protomyces lactucae-debilis]
MDDLPPADRGRAAWTFVAAATLLEMLIWGFGFTFGIFQEYYASNAPFKGASNASISAVGTVALALMYFVSFPVLPLARAYPKYIGPGMWVALAVLNLSLFLSSWVTSVGGLIVVQGVVFGLSGGLLYTPVILWLGDWFVEHRSLAAGIIFGGSGLGGVILPFLLSALLEHVGFAWTMRIWAAIYTIFGSIAVYFLRPRIPARLQVATKVRYPSLRFLKAPLFWTIGATIFFQALAFYPISLYMTTYATSFGVKAIEATLVTVIFNLCCILGQIVTGWLADGLLSYVSIMTVSTLFSALVSFLILGFARGLAMLIVYAIFFGSASGGFSAIWPRASSAVDPEISGTIFLAFAYFKGTASIIGPTVAGVLYSSHQSGKVSKDDSDYGRHGFEKVTLFVGSMMLVATLISTGIAVAPSIKKMTRGTKSSR